MPINRKKWLTYSRVYAIIFIEVKERPKELENQITGGFKMAQTSKTYKWGLFSDYGMRILNETFTTKREAQKAFREWGYTKDSEAWIEKVPMDAKRKFD